MGRIEKLKRQAINEANMRVLNEQTGRNESKSEGWNKLIWENKTNPKSYDEAYNCFNDNGIPLSGGDKFSENYKVYHSCFDVDGKKFMPDSPPCIDIINDLSDRNKLNKDIIECLLSNVTQRVSNSDKAVWSISHTP